ncbi:MAG: UTP--glucose-1-phosphate uridylyltransferase [Rhodothermales bacterium]|nr:UTP--glucose-1-phosphate uridylyltransferase [Rhodothermales bacterium]
MSSVRLTFAPHRERMEAEGLPEIAIRAFAHYFEHLLSGETGLIREHAIRPVDSLPDSEHLTDADRRAGADALPHTVMLKLNGGLGTSMGLERAKSLLPVKEGFTFLDVIARQALSRAMPLVLMNSFSTADDSRRLLAAYHGVSRSLPLDFLQHKVPKIARHDLSPVDWPHNRQLEWCPPGHGDIYTALVTSGMLEALLDAGYRYLFVSNSDNLGASVDEAILGYFASRRLPFMMEVADRTPADRKGGHLALHPDGGLLLRESAQCPDEDAGFFQDIERHRFFNTNNLWIDIQALERLIEANEGVLRLPMIRNAKTVDPRDSGSTPVFQLETAMGAAIALFEGAGAIRVPRVRFAPVKTTNELLAVQSDAYVLLPDFTIALHPTRGAHVPVVTLDPRYYRTVDQLAAHTPHGTPSLQECTSLRVEGSIRFGRGVRLIGDVHLVNEHPETVVLPDGATLEGKANV